MPFFGFPSQPLLSLKTKRGVISLYKLLLASQKAKRHMRQNRPSAVFSTGGYSAGPVMLAAKGLGIPLVIHEANSIPGRANRRFAPYAIGFSCVFHKTLEVIPTAVRLGQPIRKELRERVAASRDADRAVLLVTGGSQGAQFLNESVPAAVASMPVPPPTLLVAGRSNFAGLSGLGESVKAVPFLDAEEMAAAYGSALLAVGRSGGTLAEYAAFRIPSILVPLPGSADDHQLHNAVEFEKMNAASILPQKDASAETMASAISAWISDESRLDQARQALADWDCPNATQDIWNMAAAAAK